MGLCVKNPSKEPSCRRVDDGDTLFHLLCCSEGSKIINPFRFLEVFETWGPHVDGELITEQPIAAFQKDHWQSYKPVIMGL